MSNYTWCLRPWWSLCYHWGSYLGPWSCSSCGLCWWPWDIEQVNFLSLGTCLGPCWCLRGQLAPPLTSVVFRRASPTPKPFSSSVRELASADGMGSGKLIAWQTQLLPWSTYKVSNQYLLYLWTAGVQERPCPIEPICRISMTQGNRRIPERNLCEDPV